MFSKKYKKEMRKHANNILTLIRKKEVVLEGDIERLESILDDMYKEDTIFFEDIIIQYEEFISLY